LALNKNGSTGPQGGEHLFALPRGTKLFEFEIETVLGHGGFGITYRASDTHLEELVAIKEYLPNELGVRVSDETVRAKSTSEQPDFEAGLAAFLQEARMIARFRHRNIMQVRRFFKLHGTGYIVLEYENGETLSQRLASGPISETELRELLAQLLDGLEAIHSRAILHRDLKPSNIIIREDGTPVLIDFGAARDFTNRHSRSITAVAAPGYSPPEQYGVGGQQGPWTDFYALGAIAYRCVTGETPVDSLRRMRSDPLKPATVAAKGRYTPKLLEAIDWLLKIDEAERPKSAAEVRTALKVGPTSVAGTKGNEAQNVDVMLDESGEALIKFDQDTRADVLDLAFHVTPPGDYLHLSSTGTPKWLTEPHYFPVERTVESKRQGLFRISSEISKAIPSTARVRISSKDNFIRAAATWPNLGMSETRDHIAPRPQSKIKPKIAAAVACLFLLLFGVGIFNKDKLADVACSNFRLCSADRIAFAELQKQLANTPACDAGTYTAKFTEQFAASALLVRVAKMGDEKQNQCRREEGEAFSSADRCASQKERNDPCGVATCFQSFLTNFPNGTNTNAAKTRVDRALTACRSADERQLVTAATTCASQNPCGANQCFSIYRSRYPNGGLRAQMNDVIANAQRACASAQQAAATPTIPEVRPAFWSFNGSHISLDSNDLGRRRFLYETPNNQMLNIGVQPGTVLFEGTRIGQRYQGTAYVFSKTCGRAGFVVIGDVSSDDRIVTLVGNAPLRDLQCRITNHENVSWIFTFHDQFDNWGEAVRR
jgi:serine/threonine protein kinase